MEDRHYGVVFGVDEFQESVAEVTHILHKFIVDFGLEVFPVKDTVTLFRTVGQQVETIAFDWNATVDGIVSKDSSAPTFTELTCFVVEVFSGIDMFDHSPGLTSAY